MHREWGTWVYCSKKSAASEVCTAHLTRYLVLESWCVISLEMDNCQTKGIAMKGYQSNAEKSLHKLLITQPVGSPVNIQVQDGRCRHDFLFQREKIAVEIDGNWPWHNREANAKRDAGLVGIAVLRLPWDMPVETMREHIVHVLSETKTMEPAVKIAWVREYHLQLFNDWQSRSNQPDKTGPREDCLDCGGLGWKRIPVWSDFMGCAIERATRCSCKNLRDASKFELVSLDVEDMLRERLSRKPAQQETLFTPAESLRNRA
jgi:very-short-patch-repair endonuclease